MPSVLGVTGKTHYGRGTPYRASSNNAHTHNYAPSFNNAVWCPDEAPWLRWPLSGCPEPTKLWQREVDIWTGPLPCTPRHKSAPLGRELATYMTSHALPRCGCATGVNGSGAWFHVHLHFRATVQQHRCRPVDPSPNIECPPRLCARLLLCRLECCLLLVTVLCQRSGVPTCVHNS